VSAANDSKPDLEVSLGGGRPPDFRTSGLPDFLLFQLADSAFPAGGFVHSGGIEAAQQCGLVGADTLADWLIDALDQAGHAILPLVGAGWDAAGLSSMALHEVDLLADAWLTNHVAHRASKAQGQAWLGAVVAAFPRPALYEAKRLVRAGETPGHFAPWFGATLFQLDQGRDDTRHLFLFLHLRGLVSAAVRLALIGPLAAQRLQADLAPVMKRVLATTSHFTTDDLANLQPLHDLTHTYHDRLYSRLFNT